MVLDAAAAKLLASIIVVSTQGVDALTPQLPLEVVDRGAAWLVEGTPYTDERRQSDHVMFHVFIRKRDAEIVGLDFEARMMFPPDMMASWAKRMGADDYARVFGPPTDFEPRGIRDMVYALYGGVLNTPADAAAYAHVLMRGTPALAMIPEGDLRADERGGIWHIVARRDGRDAEVMTLSRDTGKVLSGDL